MFQLQETCWNLASLTAPPPPTPSTVAWLEGGSVTLAGELRGLAVAAPPGTAGGAQAAAPAQLALTASKAPRAWRSAQHRSWEGSKKTWRRAYWPGAEGELS